MKPSVSFTRNRQRRSLSATLVYLLLAIVTFLSCILITPALAQSPAEQLLQQSHSLYETQRYSEAIPLLQQAAQTAQQQGDFLRQAQALSNLSLSYEQLGRWQDAEAAIAQSLAIVTAQRQTQDTTQLLAQTLNIQGRIQFAQGQTAAALTTWERATTTYEQLGDRAGSLQSQLYQAQALQTLGLYDRAIALLTTLTQSFNDQPPALSHAVTLRSLGDVQLMAGDLSQARQTLEQSLKMAQAVVASNQEAIAAIYLSLGNLTRAEATASLTAAGLTTAEVLTQRDAPTPTTFTEATLQQRIKAVATAFNQQVSQASSLYQQAAATPSTHLQAQLNLFSLLVKTQQGSTAIALYPDLQTQLQTQPLTSLYDPIEFAQSAIQLHQASSQFSLSSVAQLLTTTHQQAVERGDRRIQSYALGTLGTLAKTIGDLTEAKTLTQQAIALAKAVNAADISYRWQRQLGQVFKAQRQIPDAIAAYESAFATLQSLRQDVVTTSLSYQLAFREDAEAPIYQELIDLLLLSKTPTQAQLNRSREVSTSLQVAQLENFLGEPCSDPNPERIDRTVDRIAATTAVLYPIVLPDRLEVIVKLPQVKELYHFHSQVSAKDLQSVVRSLQLDLEQEYTFDAVKANAKRLYSWIIQPVKDQLESKQVTTLVFALDGFLRSIPMSVLYDGKNYLVEQYATAVTLGLDLPNPSPLQPQTLKVLAVGLTDPPKDFKVNAPALTSASSSTSSPDFSANFAKLANVNTELDAIAASGIPLTAIRDQQFTQAAFNRTINEAPFPIVHMATHGQFSSDPKSTFLLTANGAIGADELNRLFETRGIIRPDAIELLILNACETAAGDQLAALGIAGTAFRAGARSVIASLWTLDDTSSLELTQQLYQHLGQAPTSKAAALRQAQLALLANPQFAHPRYWATYVLLGNWL